MRSDAPRALGRSRACAGRQTRPAACTLCACLSKREAPSSGSPSTRSGCPLLVTCQDEVHPFGARDSHRSRDTPLRFPPRQQPAEEGKLHVLASWPRDARPAASARAQAVFCPSYPGGPRPPPRKGRSLVTSAETRRTPWGDARLAAGPCDEAVFCPSCPGGPRTTS